MDEVTNRSTLETRHLIDGKSFLKHLKENRVHNKNKRILFGDSERVSITKKPASSNVYKDKKSVLRMGYGGFSMTKIHLNSLRSDKSKVTEICS